MRDVTSLVPGVCLPLLVYKLGYFQDISPCV